MKLDDTSWGELQRMSDAIKAEMQTRKARLGLTRPHVTPPPTHYCPTCRQRVFTT